MNNPYGYVSAYGYVGRVGNSWMNFASENEYLEYISEV